jgi:hypothetical protein
MNCLHGDRKIFFVLVALFVEWAAGDRSAVSRDEAHTLIEQKARPSLSALSSLSCHFSAALALLRDMHSFGPPSRFKCGETRLHPSLFLFLRAHSPEPVHDLLSKRARRNDENQGKSGAHGAGRK